MRKVEWTNRANKEFDHTFNYWINHNKSDIYSQKLLDETLRKVNLIVENPKIGAENKKNKLRRVLVLDNFSLTYKFSKNNIQIVSFFDNRRNPKAL
ncbi:type II toxin-antitoxin system RelE/ParE family toxin [Epilithonimonas xixisoli]|uniref:Plasmid stabilization system protein ParE n=1 Tax=Epilithonimonas xixisoli TaxID=1476462 RepID=A0A4R8IEX1_9FLAO|nr:type II toxin-antitoxin system RelE/ParE family toxin [Epilithonimonas xixisoli]TDX84318.1 plasmid stabilization system protein ParE [Epilithonimonas xixisoli]